MEYEAFKYVMTDMTSIFIGAKFSYDELLEHEDVPQKLREVIFRIFLNEVSGDTLIENHVFYLTKDSQTYKALKKMKARFKMRS